MAQGDQTVLEVMEAVQRSLREGDFSQLPTLTEALVAVEAQADLASPEELRRIRDLATRNAHLLLAARRGIRAARRRIDEVMSVARGHVAYDRKGQRIGQNDDRELARRY